jgi:hypothetical protein
VGAYLSLLIPLYAEFKADVMGDAGPFLFAVIASSGIATFFMVLLYSVSNYLAKRFPGNRYLSRISIVLLIPVLIICSAATYAWGKCVYHGLLLFIPSAICYATLVVVCSKQILGAFRASKMSH